MMTYALTRYRSYQEYLDDESLSPEGNYRLLSTGELIELSEEDNLNIEIAFSLSLKIASLEGGIFVRRIRNNNKEIQVPPVGDKRVNRKPDLMVIRPEHRESARQAILLGMEPPLFVAEVVSPGSENSDNYKRDYVWKRQQYAELGIPEYWIIDPHLARVTVLLLVGNAYEERVYTGGDLIKSNALPTLAVVAERLLRGDVL